MTEVIEKTEYKKGYKKTKLGWVPEDWKMVRFNELFDEVVNLSNDTETYPLYSLTLENGVTPKTERYERSHLLKDKNENEFKLISEGEIAINPMNLRFGAFFMSKVPETVYLSSYYDIFKAKKDTVNGIFYDAFMKSASARRLYQRIATGSLDEKKRIHLSELKKQLVPYPKKEEQDKIAEILSAWDDGIEALEKLIEQKEIFHKALMKNLLIGKIRLFEFSSKWTHSKFNSIFERITRKNEELNSNILTISAQNGLISQKDFYNKRIASVDTSKYILLKNGEFAYNKSYSNGYPLGAIKRLDQYGKGVVSSLYICFKLNNSANCSDFWKYYFEAGMLNREIKMIAQEGARNHGLLNMTTEDFFNMLLFYPKDLKEQQKIAEILNKSDEEIQLLNSKLEKLKEQKKGLMQKLLTGQIRVKV